MSEIAQNVTKVYSIMNKNTGVRLYIADVTPEKACASVHWPLEDCQIEEVPQQRHPSRFSDARTFVKLHCEVCPYQKAECRKPPDLECQCRTEVPDLDTWIKQVLKAHLCDHVGVDLTIRDYELHQKWVPFPEAIKELTPKA